MIRGSIEVARRTQISGWIYAESGTVRDRLILAFSGHRCVGAGKVDRFRKDLLDAKLGDGHCGFDFPIRLNDDEAESSVVVKLQNSDAALIQSATRLVGPEHDGGGNSGAALGSVTPAMLPWLQERGWLDQQEYDFLKAVQTVGAYERALRPPRRPNAELPPPLKPEVVARDLLGLFVLGNVEVASSRLASISDLGMPQSPMHAQGVPLMVLWSADRCRIAFDERSHVAEPGSSGQIRAAAAAGAVEYGFGPDRVLVVHRQSSFAPVGLAPATGITVLTAKVADAHSHPKTRERAA